LCKINGKVNNLIIDLHIYLLSYFEIYSIFFKSCLAFAHDELAHFVSRNLLDKDLVIWINDKLAAPFQDLFILDDDDASSYNKESYHLPRIPTEPWMKIDVRENISRFIFHQIFV
jgi:hypothetical protein